MRIQRAILLVALTGMSSIAAAAEIRFVHEGVGSGTIGTLSFSNADFTITAISDTGNRQSFNAGYFIDHDSAKISITGVGEFDFLTPTRTFVSNSGSIVGFSRAGLHGSDLMNGPSDPALGSWDMLVGIGPLNGTGGILQWGVPHTPVDTSGGVLEMPNSVLVPIEFTAFLCSDPGSAYCFGDGSDVACPCFGFGGPGEGCANSSGSGGATLTGSGCAALGNDTIQFQIDGVPGNKPGLILRGDLQVALPVGDGVLCASGMSQRSQVQITSAGSTTFTDFQGSPFGAVANIGAPTNFQFWYRDTGNTCSGAGFNFSNAWSVTYQP